MFSTILQPKQDSNPWQLLQEIFEETSIRYLRYHNWRWFRSVLEYKPYQFMGAPGKLINSWSLMVRMIQVADLLRHIAPDDSRALKRVDAAQCDTRAGEDGEHPGDRAFMKGLSHLYDHYNGHVIHLFAAEADDPCLFFRRFFELHSKAEWFSLLDEWLEYGLDKVRMAECGGAVDEMPEALELLQGLGEACWLLHKKQKAGGHIDTNDCGATSEVQREDAEPCNKHCNEGQELFGTNTAHCGETVHHKLASVFEETELNACTLISGNGFVRSSSTSPTISAASSPAQISFGYLIK